MRDCGLLTAMFEQVQFDLLQGNLQICHGAILENLVADLLGKGGEKFYYFRKDTGLEADFVISYREKITVLEVKPADGNSKRTKTLLQQAEKYKVSQVIKLGNHNVTRISSQILMLPLYMTFLLTAKC